jgi:hypothetical protein
MAVRSTGTVRSAWRFLLIRRPTFLFPTLGSPAPAVERREFDGIRDGNQFKFLKGWPEHFLWRLLLHGLITFLCNGERHFALEDITALLLIKPDLDRVLASTWEGAA